MERQVIPDQDLDHKIYRNGHEEWRYLGLLHRDQGPAVNRPNGVKIWCQRGVFHREDGPSVEHPDDTHDWYLNDVLHTFKEYCEELEKLRGPKHADLVRIRYSNIKHNKVPAFLRKDR